MRDCRLEDATAATCAEPDDVEIVDDAGPATSSLVGALDNTSKGNEEVDEVEESVSRGDEAQEAPPPKERSKSKATKLVRDDEVRDESPSKKSKKAKGKEPARGNDMPPPPSPKPSEQEEKVVRVKRRPPPRPLACRRRCLSWCQTLATTGRYRSRDMKT